MMMEFLCKTYEPLYYHNTNVIFCSTFCLIDKLKYCVAVTVFNIAKSRGVIIGDSVAIPEPYVTDVDFKYADSVST